MQGIFGAATPGDDMMKTLGLALMALAATTTAAFAQQTPTTAGVFDPGSTTFVEAGRLHEVGEKFHRWLDVVFMEKLLRDASRG